LFGTKTITLGHFEKLEEKWGKHYK